MVGAPIAFKTLVACFGALTTTINRSTRALVRRFIPSPRLERLVVRKRGSSTQGLSSSKRRETDGALSTSQIWQSKLATKGLLYFLVPLRKTGLSTQAWSISGAQEQPRCHTTRCT